ncbi:MAG: hypothetical protein U1E05_00060, partial [Patescibacteria group bacterium]|nr:hypothetical protein [Patescibacteria group bacterium]
GEEKTLVVPIGSVPPSPVAWLRDGKGKALVHPDSWAKDGYNLDRARAVSIYVYQPGQEYSYEVFGIRAVPAKAGLHRDR